MDSLKDILINIVTSDAGAAFISLCMASVAATIVKILIPNEGENSPAWKQYAGMFLRALAGSIGNNTTKKSVVPKNE